MRLGFQGRNGIILVVAYRTVISRYAGMVTAHTSASSHEPGPSLYGIFAFLEEGERDSVSPIERLVVSQTTHLLACASMGLDMERASVDLVACHQAEARRLCVDETAQ